jgi:dTDP-4-dehydrorhamnose reductase
LDLLIDGEQGIWHLTNNEATTWPALISKAAELAHVDASTLQVCGKDDLGLLATRPSYSVLGSARAALMPRLDDALARYASERERTMLEL